MGLSIQTLPNPWSTEEDFLCPRCGSREYRQHDCGPDSYHDDLAWTSDECVVCGLWYGGWTDKWYVDVYNWRDEGDAEEYSLLIPEHQVWE